VRSINTNPTKLVLLRSFRIIPFPSCFLTCTLSILTSDVASQDFAMHDGWNLEDVRCLILALLEPQDLARLAQTCRSLFNPATDELWKTFTNFSALLCCLPQDYRHKPLTREDLGRLDFYSTKVHKVILGTNDVSKAIRLPPPFNKNVKTADLPKKEWNELWEEIAGLRDVTSFMPNLRCIRVSNISEQLLIPLCGISGTKVTQIYSRRSLTFTSTIFLFGNLS
jgi:hypothetical protein